MNLSVETGEALFQSCFHSIIRIDNSTVQTLLADDNVGCSVIVTGSRVGRVAENKSVGLNVYARDTVFTNHVSLYADDFAMNATNCTILGRVVDQLHGASSEL